MALQVKQTKSGIGCKQNQRDTLRSLGSSNPINVVHATVAALKSLNRPEEIAAKRGLPIEDVAPAAMLRARAAGTEPRAGVNS